MMNDECWCECKEFDDWSSCKKGYMRHSRKCGCECDRTCKIGEWIIS